MEDDKEVSAMSAVNVALAGLESHAVARVLRWAADRYKVQLPVSGKAKELRKDKGDARGDSEEEGENATYEHFSDLFDAADPTTEADRVLVAGYWFQILQAQSELDSQSLNKELKNTGHGISHMPHALDDLMNAKPRLLVQLKKKGTTKQARRKFKLTSEGIKRVRGMLKATGE